MLSINIVAVENQSVHNLSLITSQGPIITWLGVASVPGLEVLCQGKEYYVSLKYFVSMELSLRGFSTLSKRGDFVTRLKQAMVTHC